MSTSTLLFFQIICQVDMNLYGLSSVVTISKSPNGNYIISLMLNCQLVGVGSASPYVSQLSPFNRLHMLTALLTVDIPYSFQ